MFADKSFIIVDNKLHADVNGLTDKDVIYAVFILKSIYAFYVDGALTENRTCYLRISTDMKKNLLYKPYMQSGNHGVAISYHDDYSGNGFYIANKNLYYYAEKSTQKSIALGDIKKIVTFGDYNGLHIFINNHNEYIGVVKDADAVAMLFCIICYLKSKSGIYSLVRHIDNFSKVNALKNTHHFVPTSRLQRNSIEKMAMHHFAELNPKDCIAGINTPTINMLLTIDGLYVYQK